MVDLGCGEGNLLRLLLAETQFETILGVDVSWRSLETTKERLRLDELPEHQWGRIELIQGSLTYRRDVLLQLAMPLCLVGAVRNKARTFQ